jgi:hypothetical protein
LRPQPGSQNSASPRFLTHDPRQTSFQSQNQSGQKSIF